jgi:hypothetical protein
VVARDSRARLWRLARTGACTVPLNWPRGRSFHMMHKCSATLTPNTKSQGKTARQRCHEWPWQWSCSTDSSTRHTCAHTCAKRHTYYLHCGIRSRRWRALLFSVAQLNWYCTSDRSSRAHTICNLRWLIAPWQLLSMSMALMMMTLVSRSHHVIHLIATHHLTSLHRFYLTLRCLRLH